MIVVNYNTEIHLSACLASIVPQAYEVIVVDNASRDGSCEMVLRDFPTVRLIQNTVNRGFGSANNQGMAVASGDLFLLLNSDCVLKGELSQLAAVFSDAGVVAAGGRLMKDGIAQNSCCSELTLWRVFCEQMLLERLFRGTPLFDSYWLTPRLVAAGSGAHEVAQVMGACLMLRPEERFDEDFFLYCEDTELCRRLSDNGHILYVDVPFEHALGASSSGNRGWAIAMYNRGKELYFLKHHGALAQWVCLWFNRHGALLRLLLALIRLDFGKAKMFWGVFVAPVKGPPLPADAFSRP